MAASLTDHVWSMAELLTRAFAVGGDAPAAPTSDEDLGGPSGGRPPSSSEPVGRPVASAPWLRVIEGGVS